MKSLNRVGIIFLTTMLVLGAILSYKATSKNLKADPKNVNELKKTGYDDPFFHEHQFKKMFKSGQRPDGLCRKSVDVRPGRSADDKDDEDEYVSSILPKFKPNKWKQENHGSGESAYLFDWLDGFLRDDVVKVFKAYTDELKAMAPDIVIADIYSAENQLEAYKTMGIGIFNVIGVNTVKQTEEELLKDLIKINKKITVKGYMAGVDISKFSAACRAWGYMPTNPDMQWHKRKFDKFDFDGNGRLGANEFLLFTIIHNHVNGLLGIPGAGHNYKELTREKIDGIFQFADCNGDGLIGADELWYAIKQLKRDPKLQGKYDIFKCDAYTEQPDAYNSVAVNDFILKNSKVIQGKLKIEEFRKGILLAYLFRQVDEYGVQTGDLLNEKNLRWSGDGTTDFRCQKIKNTKCLNCKMGQ